jgi:hypothetical protein
MQRERAALKVMQQMLVDRRDGPAIDEVLRSAAPSTSSSGPDRARPSTRRPQRSSARERSTPSCALLLTTGLDERAVAEQPASNSSVFTDDRLAKTLSCRLSRRTCLP